MAGFKKRVIDPSRLATAQAVAATSPLVGDPRMSVADPAPALNATTAMQGHQVPGQFVVGQVYEVPLGMIRPNPVNPRVIYTSAAVDELALSLSGEGQQVAATAFFDESTQAVVLIDGEKRLRASRAAGLPALRVEIRPRPSDDRALYESARATNLKRSEHSPVDDALRWRDMLKQGVYPSQVALGTALGVTQDVVSRTLSLAQMPQRLLHALAEDQVLLKLRLLNAVREYWESCNPEERDERTLDLINEVSRKQLGYREVESRRKALTKAPVSKPRAMREQLRLGSAKGEIKTFPDGRLELSLKGLDDEQSDKVRLALGQALKALGSGPESLG